MLQSQRNTKGLFQVNIKDVIIGSTVQNFLSLLTGDFLIEFAHNSLYSDQEILSIQHINDKFIVMMR